MQLQHRFGLPSVRENHADHVLHRPPRRVSCMLHEHRHACHDAFLSNYQVFLMRTTKRAGASLAKGLRMQAPSS